VLSAAGGASATNFTTLERKMPESPNWPSSNAQVNQNVNIELEKSAQFAAPASMQQDKRKSTSAQRQEITHQEHAMPATISTATLAAERIRRQNLADHAAAGDAFVFKLAGSGRRTPESRSTPIVQVDQDSSIELEEVVAHTHSAAAHSHYNVQRRKSNAVITPELSAAGGSSTTNLTTVKRRMPESHVWPSTNAEDDQSVKLGREKVVVHSVQQDKQKSASAQRRDIMQQIRAQTIAGLPDGAAADAQPATVSSDANASGSSQPEVHRPRVSHAVAKPSEAPPFDEKDLKLAKRREEKAASRSARK
jgi:hypothetical protein